MTIVCVASTKGGVSKTTLVVSLSDYWRRQGRKVVALDMDPNKNLQTWIGGADVPGLTVMPATEDDVFDVAKEQRQEADMVVIDVAGVLSRGMLMAFGAADAVIIPSGTSYGDVMEAGRTREEVRKAEKLANRRIVNSVVMTKTNSRLQVTAFTRQQLGEFKIPVLATEMVQRTAYQQAWYNHCSPLDMGDAALNADIRNIAEALHDDLGL